MTLGRAFRLSFRYALLSPWGLFWWYCWLPLWAGPPKPPLSPDQDRVVRTYVKGLPATTAFMIAAWGVGSLLGWGLGIGWVGNGILAYVEMAFLLALWNCWDLFESS